MKSLKFPDAPKCKLLKQIGVFLNCILPTSKDYEQIKEYLPIHQNVTDIIAACFDGIILSALLNFIDSDLIDLRALHLPADQRPISREQVIENMYAVKLCITSLDLHQFPDFGIDFEMKKDSDNLLFCWYNPKQTVDIFLLIVMHCFMGWMNKKINIFAYPELFRLCQNRNERKEAQKCSAKDWINRWIIYMKNPKIKHSPNLRAIRTRSRGLSTSIDLGGNHVPTSRFVESILCEVMIRNSKTFL